MRESIKLKGKRSHPELKGFNRRVMKKLCSMAGAPFDEVDFKKPLWFLDYEWREEDQQKFIKYLIKEMMKENQFKHYAKRFIEDSAKWMAFDYGWKLKEK